MAWLESHGNLARHPKTRRLMQRMGWTLPFTIGNLHLLWYWALEYAPTGDLTKFEPEQLTYDLDLGTSTPEEFIEAIIESGFLDRTGSGSAESRPGGTGFIDRLGSGSAESRSGGTPVEAGFLDRTADKSEDVVLRLHDWPDYTTRYIRGSKFRRKPEKWLQVVDLYSLPAPKPRQPRNAPIQALQTSLSRPVEAGHGSTFVVPPRRDTALPRIPVSNSDRQNVSTPTPSQPLPASNSHPARAGYEASLAVPPRRDPTSQDGAVVIPKCLSGRRNFTDWWKKLQECYQNKGCPLSAYEQGQLLAMLARNPFAAVEKLQYSVVNFEASYATLLTPKNQPRPELAANST